MNYIYIYIYIYHHVSSLHYIKCCSRVFVRWLLARSVGFAETVQKPLGTPPKKPSFVTDLDIHACRNSRQLSSKSGSTVMKVPGSIEC